MNIKPIPRYDDWRYAAIDKVLEEVYAEIRAIRSKEEPITKGLNDERT